MNARVDSTGKMETEGQQIEIGGNERSRFPLPELFFPSRHWVGSELTDLSPAEV